VASAISPDDIAYLTALVRAHDRPRYYATLFAPAGIRDDLFALYGFAAEIARVPEMVSEPQLGEMRLRWWSDSLAAASAASAEGETPALRAAAATIATHRLPVAPFHALIEARSADLYSDPAGSVNELEGRLGETESVLFQMAAIIAGAKGSDVADAAGHAGVAYGLARRLALVGPDRARGRTILPADILRQADITTAELFAPAPPTGLQGAVAATVGIARRHLAEAKRHGETLGGPIRFAFLPLAVVAPLLRRIETRGAEISARAAKLSDLESLVRITLARLR
jgi:phytoene synthase